MSMSNIKATTCFADHGGYNPSGRKKRVSFGNPLAVSEDSKKGKGSIGMDNPEDDAGYQNHESFTPHKRKKMKETDGDDADMLGTNYDTVPGQSYHSPYPDTDTVATETTCNTDVGEEEEQMAGPADEHPEPEPLEEHEQEEHEHDQKWEEFVEEKRARGEVKNCEGLDIFLKGRERWENANDALEQELKKFEAGMNSAIDKICDGIIAPVQLSRLNELKKQSEFCKETLTTNQQRRSSMLQSLHGANKVWKSTFKQLVSNTLDVGEKEGKDNEIDSFTNDSNTEGAEEAARLYHGAQQRLVDADEGFKEAVQYAAHAMKEKTHTMIEKIVDIHNHQAVLVNEFDESIRLDMMANHERGISYAKKLQEANESRQAFFSQLLHQVTTKGANLEKKSA